jgi:alkanesulfonate monooxygenase SsuD/methylene tetrahydromethanopterin reductase-like flavin-dependent oxidoreductase (luciferase family)
VRRWTAIGDAPAVAEWLDRYRQAGVDGFSLALATPDQTGQAERLADVGRLLSQPLL